MALRPPATRAEKIKYLIEAQNRPANMPNALPVIFNGKEPQFIGWANDAMDVDLLLLSRSKSAEKISRSETFGHKFFIAHG